MDRRIRSWAISLIALLGLAMPIPGLAQGVGAIGGTVADQSNAILPGATVTLSAPTIGGNRTVVSDEQGAYQFTRLVPGRYSVTAELSGFSTIVREGIIVNADATSRVDLQMTLGTVSELVTVTGESPAIDTTSALNQAVLTREMIDVLPARNDVFSLGRLATGVTVSKYDVGGASAFQTYLFVHGSNQHENAYLIDGMDVSNPCCAGSGSSPGRYDPFMFSEINYQLGNTPAERPMGGVIYNMVTKTGSNAFRGAMTFSGANEAMQWDNISDDFRATLLAGVPPQVLRANPTLQPNANLLYIYDAAANFGGPIVQDKLWFYATSKLGGLNQNVLGSYSLTGDHTPDDNQVANLSGKLSWQATQEGQFHFLYLWSQSAQFHRNTGRPAGDMVGAEVTAANDARTHVYQSRWTQVLSSRMVADLSGSSMNSATGGPPQTERYGVQFGDIPEYDSVLRTHTVGAPVYSDQPSWRVNLQSNLSYVAGGHDLKGGYWFNRGRYRDYTYGLSHNPAGLRAVFRNGIADSVNTYNAPVDNVRFFRENHLFIQDRWAATRNLTVNVGLRWQSTYGWQPAGCQVETIFFTGAQCFDEINGVPDWQGIAPRLSLIYDLSGNGTTAIKLSVNRYLPNPGVPHLNRVNPMRSTSDTRAWTDRNNDRIPQMDELGPSTGFNIGTTNRYDPEVKWPHVNEVSAGVQQQLPGELVVSATYFYRGNRNQIGPTNMAVPMSSYTPIPVTVEGQAVTVFNQAPSTLGQFDVLYTNHAALDSNFHGVDLSATRRLKDRWMLMGGVSFGRNLGDTFTDVNGTSGDLNNPNFQHRIGNVLFDVPVTAKATGVYDMPYGVSLSGSYQYFVGTPEQDTVLVNRSIVPTLTQVTQSIAIEPRGASRLPNLQVVDLGLRKAFRAGRVSVEPTLDIYNLFNVATVSGRVTQLGPTYHRPSSIVRGRLLKLGANMTF